MKDQNILADINWLKTAGDSDVVDVVVNIQNYIENLEDKEGRLLKMEAVLNTISEGSDGNKETILAPFKEFVNEN